MSLFLGVTLSEYLKYIYSGFRQKDSISRILNYANIAVVVLVVIVQFSAVPEQIGNTNNYHRMVSESQTSFRESVDYIKTTVPQNATVYYLSTEARQKVQGGQIDAEVFGWLLCFKGRCDIKIETLGSELPKDGYIALLSNLDVYILANDHKDLNERVDVLKEIKNGERVAYILRMKK
jgi:hypothetical protein